MSSAPRTADARVSTGDDAAALAAALEAGNDSDGGVVVIDDDDGPPSRGDDRATPSTATTTAAAPVVDDDAEVIDLVSSESDEEAPAVAVAPPPTTMVVEARPKTDAPTPQTEAPTETTTTTTTEATEATTNEATRMMTSAANDAADALAARVVPMERTADVDGDEVLARVEQAVCAVYNLERLRHAQASADATRDAFGACEDEASARKEAKRLVRRYVQELKAMFREEWASWARRVVVEQQKDGASTSTTAWDAPKKAFTPAFWSRDAPERASGSENLPISNHFVKSHCLRNRLRFSRDAWRRWAPEGSTTTTKALVKRVQGGRAVPAYSYFAYSTHCNSYDREDNFSRLLFRDDDGEFLESDPIDRTVDDTELSRETQFLLTGIFASFSKPITFVPSATSTAAGAAVPRETRWYDVIKQTIVEEAADVLRIDTEEVVEWFKEAQRGGESTIRPWLIFRSYANQINRAMQRVLSRWCIYAADLLSVLKVLGVDTLFWLSFARKIINVPTVAPRAQPVIHFDTFEDAAEQLAGAFCPRCYIFDCRLHGSLQPKSAGRKLDAEERLKRRLRRIEHHFVPYSRENPCGPMCWFTTDEYKFYSESAATCEPCDPNEARAASSMAAPKTDPYKSGRRGWRNPMDQQILTKAIDIIGKDAATPCEVSLFFGTRRGCADVGRQMHHLAMIAEGTDVAEDEEMKNVVKADEKKRKRASHSKGFAKYSKGSSHPTIQRRFKMGRKADTVWTQYVPCDCEGQCDKDTCPCVKVGNFCERFCNCGPNCWNEFDGCNCKAGARGTCKTGTCPCFAAGRECNPDKCRRCCKVADAVVHPIRQRHGFVDMNVEVKMPDLPCENMKLQLRQKEHVCLGRSEIAGWGSYILHGVRKGDFIGEYVGELISQNEADRRGRVYDQNNCSYLFNLNSEWVVDAQNRGNKLRFANHSREANCHARILLVNGDNRLGIYASQDLAPGAELFYDYHYTDEVAPEWHAQDDGSKKSKSSLIARKTAHGK